MKFPKIILLSIFVFLLVLNTAAASTWVDDPSDCPTSFQSQNCIGGERMCGYDSGIVYCYDMSSLSAPAGSVTTSSNNIGGFDGGYLLDCEAYDGSSPNCDNSGAFWCDRNSSCYSVNRQTNCTGGSFGASTCDVCISGYTYCDGSYTDGDGCEIDIGTTSYPGEANATYNSTCNPECSGSYLDCNGDLGSSGNGCEILDGGACTVGVLSGNYSGCSGSVGNCVVTKSYFETGTETAYSTSDALLWGVQYGSGYLINMTNANTNETLGINNSGCIMFPDGTAQCSGTTGLWTQNGTDIYYTDGNVGIGTNSPDYELDVNGDTNINGTIYSGTVYGYVRNGEVGFAERHISTGEFISDNISITANGTIVSTQWGMDGLRLFVTTENEYIYQYNLTVPYDITTANYSTNNTFTATGNTGYFTLWNDDGTVFWHGGRQARKITLANPWDISNITNDEFRANIAFRNPFWLYDLKWKSDGTRVYGLGYNLDQSEPMSFIEWGVTTPFDFDTKYNLEGDSAVNATIHDFPSGMLTGNSARGFDISADGFTVYVSRIDGIEYEVELGTAWDLSTGTLRNTVTRTQHIDMRNYDVSPDATSITSITPAGLIVQKKLGLETNNLVANGDVLVVGDLNVTGTSYLGDVTINADNITVNNIISRDGNISFYNNSGSETVRITQDGKVGIGTTSPDSDLHVVGDLCLETSDSGYCPNSNHGDLYFGPDTSGEGIQFDYVNGVFYVGNMTGGKWHMVIEDGGDVGIGTITPSYKLEVNGDVSLNDTLFVTESGNVGIGTTSPSQLLHVDGGKIRVDSSSDPAVILNFTGGKSAALVAGSSLASFIYDDSGDFSIQARTSAQVISGSPSMADSVLLIDSSGNVGIGTTSPTSKLEINGNVSLNNTLYVIESGDVGIGTSSPNIEFDLRGDGYAYDGLLADRIIYQELWPGGDGDLAGTLGTWTFSGSPTNPSGTPLTASAPYGNYQSWNDGTSVTLESPCLDLSEYLDITGSAAGDLQSFTDTRVYVKFYVYTDSIDSTSEYLALEVNRDGTWNEVFRDYSNEDSGTDRGWVKGTADITPFINDTNADTSCTQIRFSAPFINAGGDYLGVGRIYIYESDQPSIFSARTITTNGDVGIGTNSPVKKLHVLGDFYSHKEPNIPAREFVMNNTWITRTAPSTSRDIAWSPELGMFAAVSSNVMTSTDGITWTSRTAPTSNLFVSIVWSPELGMFAAVSLSGTGDRVMTSSDGITWISRTSAADNDWFDIAWSPELGLFVAVAETGTSRVMTSSDGITWTARTAADEGSKWHSVIWSPELGLFVAVAETGTSRVMTSSDGITWTARTASADNQWEAVEWSPELGLFVAVADIGTNSVMTSPDGITWTNRTAAYDLNGEWEGIAWSPELGMFAAVAVTGSSNKLMMSGDGINWINGTDVSDSNWRNIAWSPELGMFAAVSGGGTGESVMTSSSYKNANLAWGGNVGIGTSTPSQALEVSGNVSITGSLISDNACGIPSAVFWGEENAALDPTSYEWGYGNGCDEPNCDDTGMLQACSGTITAMSVQCDSCTLLTSTVEVQISNAGTNCETDIDTAGGAGGTYGLDTGCTDTFSAGDFIQFYTIDDDGACQYCVATVWIRYD